MQEKITNAVSCRKPKKAEIICKESSTSESQTSDFKHSEENTKKKHEDNMLKSCIHPKHSAQTSNVKRTDAFISLESKKDFPNYVGDYGKISMCIT